MLSQKELDFIEYWKKVRLEYSTISSKMLRGLPMALLFTCPILVSMALVYFLSPEWYTKISQTAGSSFSAILFALLGIVLFFSFMRMHFKWEMNEQAYQELLQKQHNQNSKP